jgi:hypothetical protein
MEQLSPLEKLSLRLIGTVVISSAILYYTFQVSISASIFYALLSNLNVFAFFLNIYGTEYLLFSIYVTYLWETSFILLLINFASIKLLGFNLTLMFIYPILFYIWQFNQILFGIIISIPILFLIYICFGYTECGGCDSCRRQRVERILEILILQGEGNQEERQETHDRQVRDARGYLSSSSDEETLQSRGSQAKRRKRLRQKEKRRSGVSNEQENLDPVFMSSRALGRLLNNRRHTGSRVATINTYSILDVDERDTLPPDPPEEVQVGEIGERRGAKPKGSRSSFIRTDSMLDIDVFPCESVQDLQVGRNAGEDGCCPVCQTSCMPS